MDWSKAPWPRKRPDLVYIRFGRWSARSKNFMTGIKEIGVSVCPAILNPDLSVSLLSKHCQDIWWEQLRGQGRTVCAVTGKLVGRGSDGEPLLRGVRCLPYAIDRKSIPDLR